jgi:hypothetical protein
MVGPDLSGGRGPGEPDRIGLDPLLPQAVEFASPYPQLFRQFTVRLQRALVVARRPHEGQRRAAAPPST